MPEPGPKELLQTRSQIGVAVKRGNPDDVRNARRDHAAAKIAATVAKVLADAPPLTDAQRDRIAGLLQGGAFA